MRIMNTSEKVLQNISHTPNSSTGGLIFCVIATAKTQSLYSGALGAGLAIFSRFPIIATEIQPYSLNGAPIDVVGGDWFVGKAAASVIIVHPILGEVQVFNTHVSHISASLLLSELNPI